MATVQSILARKGREVVSVGVAETALAAAEKMNERSIGGLVVIDGDEIVGIVTERDILRRLVAVRRDPAHTPVREIMTTPVASCRPETTLAECREFMTAHRIRHLPVLDQHGLCGIVTIGDLLAQEVDEHETTIGFLSRYIQGEHS